MYREEEKQKSSLLAVILVSDTFLSMLKASQIVYYK